MKVGGTQRRLDGALTFLALAARCLLTFCLASADFRVRDSGTTSLPTGLGRLRPAGSAPGQPRRCAGPHVRAVSVVAGPPVGDLWSEERRVAEETPTWGDRVLAALLR